MCYCHILVKEVVQLPVILQCEAPTVLVLLPPFSVSFHCDDVMMYNGVDRKPKQLRQGRRHEFHLLVWSVIFLCWIILISWMTSADFSPHVTRKTDLSINTHARTNAQTQTPSLYNRALCSLLTPGSDFLYFTAPIRSTSTSPAQNAGQNRHLAPQTLQTPLSSQYTGRTIPCTTST